MCLIQDNGTLKQQHSFMSCTLQWNKWSYKLYEKVQLDHSSKNQWINILSGLTSVTPKLDSLVNEVIRSIS
jgi:hypothetical protein